MEKDDFGVSELCNPWTIGKKFDTRDYVGEFAFVLSGFLAKLYLQF